ATSRRSSRPKRQSRSARRARPSLPTASPQAFDPAAGAMPATPGPATMFPPPSPAYLESTGISQEIYIRALRLLRDKLRERAACEDAAAAEAKTPTDAEPATITTPATGEHTDTSLSSSDPEPRPP
ncbi:MAG: hypothetical protein K8T25_15060, partial [Planctomycetia bacterium]|nr:hypothetical protein [Planctomycetia bacterium]